MRISLVVAMSRNRVIGRDNRLPWRMPADMRHFKRLTMDHAVIMGRKTFESLPVKPLPGRTSIVITRRRDYPTDGAMVASDLNEALAIATDMDRSRHHKGEVFVLGGAEIFALALSAADRIHMTLIDVDIEGHTHFPVLDASQWMLTQDEPHAADDQHPHPWRFQVYERRRAESASD
jgi:dihydrofolate reductase